MRQLQEFFERNPLKEPEVNIPQIPRTDNNRLYSHRVGSLINYETLSSLLWKVLASNVAKSAID